MHQHALPCSLRHNKHPLTKSQSIDPDDLEHKEEESRMEEDSIHIEVKISIMDSTQTGLWHGLHKAGKVTTPKLNSTTD